MRGMDMGRLRRMHPLYHSCGASGARRDESAARGRNLVVSSRTAGESGPALGVELPVVAHPLQTVVEPAVHSWDGEPISRFATGDQHGQIGQGDAVFADQLARPLADDGVEEALDGEAGV